LKKLVRERKKMILKKENLKQTKRTKKLVAVSLFIVPIILLFLVAPSTFAAGAYAITISPSRSVVKVGDCLYFTGTVTSNGYPAVGIPISVIDPIKQQSIVNAVVTDKSGKFT
jgi:hypothetical protein